MKPLSRNSFKTSSKPVRILQFGNGNFLRGFADWMVDIANEKGVFNGSIHTVQTHSRTGFDDMKNQDCLYHVLEKGMKDGALFQSSRLITSVSAISNPYDGYEEYLKLGENPDLRFIISNTTEAGIQFDPSDLEINEIASSFPGKLTALLFHRFVHFSGDFAKGVIMIPCELIEQNGLHLKTCIQQYASFWRLPAAFSEWIDIACIFCDTLVDRIVPGFPKDTIDEVQTQLGYEDTLAVMSEPFHLWVIEGPDSVKQEFPLDLAGLDVKFVKDLSPYRTRKVRILNGGHTALVPWAYLNGLRTVRESVEDPHISGFLRKVIFHEIIPSLDMPKEELEEFAEAVLERFANPFIIHELKSIALNSISKFRVRVLPSIVGYRDKKGTWPPGLIQSFAALLVFYKGEYKGEIMPLNDELAILEFFKKVWEQDNSLDSKVKTILGNEALWGKNLDIEEGLRAELVFAIQDILPLP